MSELTTYCSDCLHNHTDKCMDARKNSWCCPDYVKKMTKHEKHIMRIAEELKDCLDCYSGCPNADICDSSRQCEEWLYDWMMSLKEE